MLSTIVFIAIFAGLLLTWAVLWALLLRIGLRWSRASDVTTMRVVQTTGIVITLQIAFNILFISIPRASYAQSVFLGIAELATAVVVPCMVICAVFKARFLRAFQAWLPTLLATVATLAIAFFVLRPFLYEAFVVPTNAMAPTLVGSHWKGTCPACGQPNYCTSRDGQYGAADHQLMICDNFHVTEASDIDKTVHSSDRFMVAKFLSPRRWDVVVFNYPAEPTTLHVKRLVGFPGETIHIENGSVWVDGQRQETPASLQGIEYLSELPDWIGPELWGSVNRPALLGNDEYFVLGDFSAQSTDSRLWEQGAPAHSPFAVPKSYVMGVVTHTFWPPQRWRIHR